MNTFYHDDQLSPYPPDIPLKQCTKCPGVYPATSEFFPYVWKRGKKFLRAHCKECNRTIGRAKYHAKHPKEVLEEGKKRCSKCNDVQNIEEFPFTSKANNQRSSWCKHCYKEWRDTHPDYEQTYRKPYRERRKEHIRKRRHEQYEANKEAIIEDHKQYRKDNPEKVHASLKRYSQTPHGRRVIHATKMRRRARKKNIPGNLTVQEEQAKLEAQKYRCYYAACGFAKFEKRKDGSYIYWLDHTIPIARPEHNPRHDVNYTVLACKACNMKKWAKLPHEWDGSGRLF